MNRRLMISLFVAGVVVLAGGVWLNWPTPVESALVVIQDRGTLRVGLDASFPPFEVLDFEGQVIGLDADLARAIASDLGVEVEFVNIGYDGLYDALLVGRVDMIISGLPIDPLKTEDVIYSTPYFNAGQVLTTHRPAVPALEALAGEKVGVEWGSAGEMEARRLQKTMPTLEVVLYPDAVGAMQAEIAIVDAISALSRPELTFGPYLTEDWYAIAVPAEDELLVQAVNETLRRLEASGEMKAWQEKWFTTDFATISPP